jgi:hypothetical protein
VLQLCASVTFDPKQIIHRDSHALLHFFTNLGALTEGEILGLSGATSQLIREVRCRWKLEVPLSGNAWTFVGSIGYIQVFLALPLPDDISLASSK